MLAAETPIKLDGLTSVLVACTIPLVFLLGKPPRNFMAAAGH